MRCISESEMTIVLALNIKAIGIRKSFGIAVRCRHHRDHRLPLADLLPTQHPIGGGKARRVLAWTFIPQHLLHRGWNQRQIILQSFHLLRVAKQCEHTVADQVGGRFLTAHHGHDRVRDDLFFRQMVTVNLRREQRMDQPFPLMLLDFANGIAKISRHLVYRPQH